MKNVFGSSSDSILSNTREAINTSENLSKFPFNSINKKLLVNSILTADEIDKLLATNYKTKYSFLLLSLLYPNRNWKDKKFQEDHIFPKSFFNKTNLKKIIKDEDKINQYLKYYNCILNLQLLTDSENNEKRAKDFNEWIETQDDSFKTRHSIPILSNYDVNNFLEFINSRKEIILKKLSNIMFIE